MINESTRRSRAAAPQALALTRRLGLLAPAVAMAIGSTAYAVVPPPPVRQNDWTGVTGLNWSDAVSWDFDDDKNSGTPGIDALPSTADNHFATINNGATVIVNDAREAAFLTLGTTYRASDDFDFGALQIEAGAVLTLGEFRVGGRESLRSLLAPDPTDPADTNLYLNDGGTGSVVQSGGIVNVNYTHGMTTGTPPVNYEPPIQSMYIGDGGNDLTTPAGTNHANGSYTLTGGSILSGIANNDSIIVGTGAGTVGTFHQSTATGASSVTTTGFITVGRRGATGTYTLTGGTVTTGSGTTGGTRDLWVGDGESAGVTTTSGTFTQSGGTVNVGAGLEVGRRSGTGAYTLSGGTINAAGFVIGAGGSSTDANLLKGRGTFTMNQNDGTSAVTVSGNGNVGFTTTTTATVGGDSTGTLNVDAGTLTFSGASAIVGLGNGPGARGTINLAGGKIEMTGTGATAPLLDIGRNTGVQGILNVKGTGVLDAKEILINSSHNAAVGYPTATRQINVSQTGDLNANLVWFGNARALLDVREINVTGGTFDVATYRTGNPGVLNVSGGVTTITTINDAGTTNNGTVNINGGTFNVTGSYFMARGGLTTTVPTLNITAGTGTINSLTTTNTGLLAISGGSVAITSLVLSSGSTLKTDNAISLASNVEMGDATVNVNTGSLALTGTITSTLARTLTKVGPGTLTMSGVQTHAAGSVFNVNAGTLNLNASGGANLTVNTNGTTNFGVGQRLNNVNVGAGGTVELTGGVDKTLHVNGLSINPSGGKLLTNDNDLLVEYGVNPSPEAQIRQWVKDGRTIGSTTGIFATPGNPDDDVVLAVADNAAWGKTVFNGINITTNTVVGKYTYFGDANLDGKVTGDDYLNVDANLGTGDSWLEGDFNMSGVTTGDDYLAIDANLGKGTADPLAFAELKEEMVALHVAMFGDEYLVKLAQAEAEGFGASVVPEPAAVSLIGIGAVGLLGRRRRSSK